MLELNVPLHNHSMHTSSSWLHI